MWWESKTIAGQVFKDKLQRSGASGQGAYITFCLAAAVEIQQWLKRALFLFFRPISMVHSSDFSWPGIEAVRLHEPQQEKRNTYVRGLPLS